MISRKKTIALLLTIISGAFSVNAAANGEWLDSLSVTAELSVSGASNKNLQPLWNYSLEWGVYTQYKQAEALTHIKADYRIANFKYFTLHAGLGIVGKTELKRSMIHEAYLAGKILIFDYTAGLHAFSPLAKYDKMTSGNYLMSSNARPTPRVGIGLFDYWSVPLTHDWLQIKGGLYIGRLFNEDYDEKYTQSYTKDVLFHEKFAFVRFGGWYVKPYFGLTHSVMMGGTLPNGTEIPTDFWSSFFGKGSDKFTGSMRGESTNAAGGHQGLWDVGFDLNVDAFDTHLYIQKPFTDGVGTRFFSHCKDFIGGFVFDFKHSRLKSIGLEILKTSEQNGDGMADPAGYDKNGKYIYVFDGDINSSDPIECQKWLDDHIDSKYVSAWENETGMKANENIYAFYSDHWNHGERFGGRSNYLSNGYYMQGWTSEGLSMSSVYFLTQQRTNIIAGNPTLEHVTSFPNIRVNGVTLSAEYQASEKITIFAKLGITNNLGNRVEKFNGSHTWVLADNYYFTSSMTEYYSKLSLDYKLNSNINLVASYAGDWGDLYKSHGLRISAKYRF